MIKSFSSGLISHSKPLSVLNPQYNRSPQYRDEEQFFENLQHNSYLLNDSQIYSATNQSHERLKKRIKLQSYKNFPPDFFGHPSSVTNKKITNEQSQVQLPACRSAKQTNLMGHTQMINCSKIANETPDFKYNPFPSIENFQQIDQEQRSQSRHRTNVFYQNQGYFGGKVIHTEISTEENYLHTGKENLSKSELNNNGRLRFLPQTTKPQVERNNQQINNFYLEKENSSKHGSPQRRAALSLLEETFMNSQLDQNLYHGNSFDRVITEIPKSPTLAKNSPYFNSFCTKGLISEKIPNNLSYNKSNKNDFKALQSLLMSPVKIIQSSGGSHSLSKANRLYSQHLTKDKSQPCLPRIPSLDSMDLFKKDNSTSFRSPHQKICIDSNLSPSNIEQTLINNTNIKRNTPARARPISKPPREKAQKAFLVPPEQVLNREKTPNFSEENNDNSLKSLIEKVVEKKRQNIQGSLQTTLKSPKESFEFSFSKKFLETEAKNNVEDDKEVAENKDSTAESSNTSNTTELKIPKQKKVGPIARKKVVLRKKLI